MQKLQSGIFYTILASEIGHVFCCVIPTVLSLLALGASYGLVATLPDFLVSFHSFMHQWEKLVILVSGTLLALGWLLYWLSLRINGAADCCGGDHTKTGKTGNKTVLVMSVASVLFCLNLGIYLGVHQGAGADFGVQNHHAAHENGAHEHTAHTHE